MQTQKGKTGDLVKQYRRTGKMLSAVEADSMTLSIMKVDKSRGGDTMAKVNSFINTSHCQFGIETISRGYLVVLAVAPSSLPDMICCKVVDGAGKQEIITVSRYQKFDFYLGD